MGRLEKAGKDFIDGVSDSKLEGLSDVQRTLASDDTFRLDNQGLTSDKTAHNLQIQVNSKPKITSLRKYAPNTVATVLVPSGTEVAVVRPALHQSLKAGGEVVDLRLNTSLSILPGDLTVDVKSLPSLIIGTTRKVSAISYAINLALATDHVVSKREDLVRHVREIQGVIGHLVANVRPLVDLQVDDVLRHRGQLVSLVDLGRRIGDLIYIIFTALYLVLSIVGDDFRDVLNLIGIDLVLLLPYIIEIAGDDIIYHINGVHRDLVLLIGGGLSYGNVLSALKLSTVV